MIARLVLIALCLMSCACAGKIKVSPPVGSSVTASTGSPMVIWEFWRLLPFWRKVLTYGGAQGKTIKIGYREATQARDGTMVNVFAASQELSYDLTSESELVFQDVAIEVHRFDSNSITYTVTRAPVVQ